MDNWLKIDITKDEIILNDMSTGEREERNFQLKIFNSNILSKQTGKVPPLNPDFPTY